MAMLRINFVLHVFVLSIVLISAQNEDAAQDGPRLVWTELHSGERARITSLPAEPTYSNSQMVATRFYYQSENSQFVAIDGDYAQRTAFWSSAHNRTIFRGGLGIGVSGQSMFKGTSKSVEGLAVDWLSRNVYWTDASYDWIMISDYNATYYSIIIDTGLEKPRGIAAYPQKGYLFWTDWGEEKLIERSTLAGKNRTVLVNNTNLYFPNGLAVDYATGRIYWVDAARDGARIESMDVNGSNRTLLIEMEPRVAHFFDLAIYGNNIFVTDLTRQLRCFKKDTGAVAFSLNLGARPFGIMTYGAGIQTVINSPCDSNPCAHLCTIAPEDQGYQCVCRHGYELTENGTGCVRDESKISKPQLLVVTRNEITRFPANFADITSKTALAGKKVVENKVLLVALDVDTREEALFFTDYGKKEINRVRLVSGDSIKVVVGGVGSAEGVALDWLNQNLYWADAQRRHIAVSRYDGKRRWYLFEDNVITPRSLVIHAAQKLLFWTEFGPPSQIERGNLDGTGRMVIKTGISSPNGLAIDFKQNRLYYGARGNGVIESMDFNGRQTSRIYHKSNAKYFDIDIYKDYLYFTEWGADNGVHAINLNTNEIVKSLPLTKTAYGVRMYDNSRQPDGPSVCDEDTCDHLCLPKSSGGFRCQCSIGFSLDADNVTCNVDLIEDNFVLMTDTHIPAIFQVSLEDGMRRFTALPLEGLVRPIAVTFDPVESRVYWTDVRLGSFSRAFLNGTGQETLGRAGIDGPDGMTVDPISRLLYWTDVGRNTVTAASLDGTHIKTLIDTDLDQPRAIVVDPVGGYMYISDWGKVPKIEKAHMDGSNRVVLVDTEIKWPNGLALDTEGGKLYWADAKVDRIERINLDGTGREVLLDLSPAGHPYGIALYGPHIYWSDWKKFGLQRALKSDGSGGQLIGPQTFTRINEILVYNSTQQLSGTNACSRDNGGCSHLCIPTPVGRTCACPDGIQLDNETSTLCITSNLTCPSRLAFGHFLDEDCSYTPGRRCTVECDPGYWSESENYDVLCMPTGRWEKDMTTFCTVVECPELNITANATAVDCPGPPLQNSTCIQECLIGYNRTSGAAELKCQKDGTWSDSPLACAAVTCPPLENPPNGIIRPANCNTDGGRFDDRCLLFCQHGYLHQGVSARSCQMDGHWTDEDIESECVDGEPPSFGDACPDSQTLEADRGQTYALLNITAPVATDNSGGVITYEASQSAPYRFDAGENTVTVIARDEANNTAICEFQVNVTVLECDYLSVPLNGYIDQNCTYNYGSVCRFVCNDGYRLIGQSERSCDYGDDGELRWLGEKAACEAITCPEPITDPTKFYVEGCEAPYTPGVECSFFCSADYHRVNGSSVRTCQDNGTWSGEDFYCHIRVCGPLEPFERGIIQPESCLRGGTIGNVCTFSCTEGFQYQGKAEHVCLASGEWQNQRDSPMCEDATAPHFNGTCPEDIVVDAPPGRTEANVTWELLQPVDAHSEIHNVTYSHEPGTTFQEGTTAVIVTALDTLGNKGTCRFYVTVRVLRCSGQPQLPNNARFNGSCETRVGDKCSIGCRRGYNLSGAQTFKCVQRNDGTAAWETLGNQPVCQAIMCHPLQQSRGSSVMSCAPNQPLPFGTQCSIICAGISIGRSFAGLFPRMMLRLVCQADGTWRNNFNPLDEITEGTDPCQRKCPPFALPGNAVLDPVSSAECSSGSSAPRGARCTVECQEGYGIPSQGRPSRPMIYRCLSSGNWAPPVPQRIFCRDVTPPQFEGDCPRNYTYYTPECSLQVNVTYDTPTATDNSGESVYVKGPRGMTMPMLLQRGRHQRMYTAADRAGNTARCQVNIDVISRTCPAPQRDGLRIEESTCRNLYGSVNSFACMSSMNLVGQRELTCLENGSWSGPLPICERVTCPDLPLPANTMPLLQICHLMPTVLRMYTELCQVRCNVGYRMAPERVTIVPRCQQNGTWTGTEGLDDIECIDVAPPRFDFCPDGFSVPLDPGSSTASVSWEQPSAIDNGDTVRVTGPDTSAILGPGAEVFTYVATDAAGLSTRCIFEVTVVDLEPPTVIGCPDDVNVIQSDTLPVQVNYDEPMFDDNVGIAHKRHLQYYSRYRWTNSMSYEWGYTEVHYMALDRDGNMATCEMKFEFVQSTDCPQLIEPPNSVLTCDEANTQCTLQCNPGYYFEETGEQTPLYYVCQSSGLWNHSTPRNENPYLPVCTQRETADRNQWTMLNSFVFRVTGDCSSSKEELESEFSSFFRTSNLWKSCMTSQFTYCFTSVGSVSCDRSGVDGVDRRGRRRRQATSSVDVTSDAILSIAMGASRGGLQIPSFIRANTSVENLWTENNISLSLTNSTVVLDKERSSLGSFSPRCPHGQVESKFICVQCPPGTYTDTRTDSCNPCPKNQFQDEIGQTQCKSCPSGMGTRATGAFRIDQCQVKCSAGTYSYTGLGPDCLDCPVGTYQEEVAQRGCRPCQANTTTSRAGSPSSNACIDPSDVTSPLPTTTDADNAEISPSPVTDTNHPDEQTTQGVVRVQSTPAIIITVEPTPEPRNTGSTLKSGGVGTPGRNTGDKAKNKNVGLAVGATIGLLIVIILLIVGYVLYRRRYNTIPMTKLNNITITPSDQLANENFYEDDDEDLGTSVGRYHQMQEMDNFDLEHLTPYGDSPLAEKRNSFSNVMYSSEDDPKPVFPTQVWTTFDDNAESEA